MTLTLRVLADLVDARALAALINTTVSEIALLSKNCTTEADHRALTSYETLYDSFMFAWSYAEVDSTPAAFAAAWDDFLSGQKPTHQNRLTKSVKRSLRVTMAETQSSFLRLAAVSTTRFGSLSETLAGVYNTDRQLVAA